MGANRTITQGKKPVKCCMPCATPASAVDLGHKGTGEPEMGDDSEPRTQQERAVSVSSPHPPG